MIEQQKARAWRAQRGLTVARLAELTGYSREAVYLMERGKAASGDSVAPWAWQRFKCACAGIDAQLRSGINFEWGK